MSSNSDIIPISEIDNGDGNLIVMVTQPSSMNKEATLTATLTKGGARDTKTFGPLTVIISDVGAIQQAMLSLTIGYGTGDRDTRVTGDIMLPAMGGDGVTISWASEPIGIVSTAEATLGEVTRPNDMDTMVHPHRNPYQRRCKRYENLPPSHHHHFGSRHKY